MAGKQNAMEEAYRDACGPPWLNNTNRTNSLEASNATEGNTALDRTLPQRNDAGSDSGCSTGTSFDDIIASTTQEDESHVGKATTGSDVVHSINLPEPLARQIINERLRVATKKAAWRVDHLRLMEEACHDIAFENAVWQQLVQIRETLKAAEENLELLMSLQKSANLLAVLDLRFLLKNLI
ncbi:hypothetical protein BJY01DRAFT_255012 [Aspergillus pseudoustus]|uniref:Uncharacterized protein n=1 Tax=Aspergillus pseudoustus TaxID=1810923 RepID=A0ABR4INP1_9EURO